MFSLDIILYEAYLLVLVHRILAQCSCLLEPNAYFKLYFIHEHTHNKNITKPLFFMFMKRLDA